MGRRSDDRRAGDDDRPEWDRMWTGLRDAEFLGPEDGVRKRGLVSINTGWLARGGLLRLYADRLEFEPNPLERLLLARRRTLSFADIEAFERRPERPEEVSPIGQTARMRLHMRGGSHIDVIPAGATLDDWLAAIRQPWDWFRRVNEEEEVEA